MSFKDLTVAPCVNYSSEIPGNTYDWVHCLEKESNMLSTVSERQRRGQLPALHICRSGSKRLRSFPIDGLLSLNIRDEVI